MGDRCYAGETDGIAVRPSAGISFSGIMFFFGHLAVFIVGVADDSAFSAYPMTDTASSIIENKTVPTFGILDHQQAASAISNIAGDPSITANTLCGTDRAPFTIV